MWGLNVTKEGCGVSLIDTYLGCVNCGVWCVWYVGVWWIWFVYSSKAKWEMKAGVTLALMYHACARGFPDKNVADWMTHPEEVGHWKEVVWHHHWANSNRISLEKPTRRHKRRNWVNWSCITCKRIDRNGELGTNPLPWNIQEVLWHNLGCNPGIHLALAHHPTYKWLLCSHVYQGWPPEHMHHIAWRT